MKMEEYQQGTFCWNELGTSNPEKSKQFYRELFLWTVKETAFGDNKTYTVFQVDGQDVAAMYELEEQEKERNAPAFWGSYIAVKDVEAAAKKVTELGGELLSGPREVSDKGKMCVFRDPTGAVAALWEANRHIGAGVVHSPYSVDWHELFTSDIHQASDFYSQLLNWTKEEIPTPAGLYLNFKAGSDYAAGMNQISKEMEPMPSSWGIYFKVPNCDETVLKATELGATVIVPPMDVPGSGRFATIQDPQGAFFSIQHGFQG